MKVFAAILLYLLTFFIASSVGYTECSGFNCRNVMVNRIYIRADGNVLIDTNDDEKKLSVCTPDEDRYIYLMDNHKNKKEIYAALLSAKLAGEMVWIRVTEGKSPCQVQYIVLE